VKLHTHKGTYLAKRLKVPDITDSENRCKGFITFKPYYYSALSRDFKELSSDKKDKHHRYADYRKSINEDNILISYCDLFGFFISEGRTILGDWHNGYEPEGTPQTFSRLRAHPSHLFIDKDGKTYKYKTARKAGNYPFINGIYAYYIKPLLNKGLTKQQAIEKLKPTFQKIAITEGEFKAFIGCKNGFPTIGVSGIHNAVKTIKKTVNKGTLKKEFEITIDAEFLPELKEFIEVFEVKELFFLMDSDLFDNQDRPNRAKGFFGAIRNFWFAAKNAAVKMSFSYIKPNAGGKGLDDLILAKNGNRAQIKESIGTIDLSQWQAVEKLQYSFAESVLKYPSLYNDNRETIHLPEGKKLSTGITIEQTFDKILIAPTGSGKTFLVDTCKDWMIIICPTTALCENVADEYGAYYFSAKEQHEFDNDMDNLSRKFIAVTYDSFKKLTGYLSGHENKFRVFIDESHNFTLAANYRLKALTGVVELSKKYRSVTLLTGTYIPCFHPAIMKMQVIQVLQPRKEVKAELLECSDVLKGAQYLAQQSINSGHFPLILFNSKNTAGRLGTLKTYLKDLNFAFFNADTKKEKDWQLITSKGQIAPNYQGMCVTSVLKEGNNIYNQYDFDIIIIGNFHSIEIEQFSRRPRQPKSLRIYKLVGQSRTKQEQTTGVYSLASNMLYKSIATCNELNTHDAVDFELMENEFYARQAIATLPINLNKDKEYQTDFLRLSNFAFQLDTTQENRNIKLLQSRLSKYSIILNDSKQLDIEKDAIETELAKVSKDEAKAIKENQFDTLLADLEHKEIFTLAINQLSYHSKVLSPIEKLVFKRIKSLANLMGSKEPVLNAIKDARLSDARFKLLRQREVIQLLKADDTYMASNRKFSIVLKAIYNKFKDGDKLGATAIRFKLIDVLKIDKGLDISRLEKGSLDSMNKKAISILKLFFQIEIKREMKRGVRILKYTLLATKRDNIIRNKSNLVAKFEELNKKGNPKFWEKLIKT